MSADEYIGDPDTWERLVHPDDVAEALGAWKAALAARRPWSLEYRVVRPDGRIIWVRDESTLARMTTAPSCRSRASCTTSPNESSPNRR